MSASATTIKGRETEGLSISHGAVGGLPPLSMAQKLGYGSGEIASNLAWNMVTGFLLFYYTDVALLPAAALGTLMLVGRILDAVFDPAVGILVDRTRTRWGKARPYLLFAAVPYGLVTVVTFTVPELSQNGRLLYAWATFMVLGLLHSLLYVPYSALLPMMTRDRAERVQLGSFRSMATSIASIFVYGLTMPLVALLGDGDRQLGFTLTAVIMSGATAVFYFIVFGVCRERISADVRAVAMPVRRSIGQMVRNPIWLIAFFMALLVFVRLGATVSTVAFFAKSVLGQPWMMSALLPVLSVGILLGGFIAGFYLRRYSKRGGNLIAIVLSIAVFLSMSLAQNNPVIFIVLFGLSHVAIGIHATTVFVIIAEAVDVHEERFHHRAEGLLVASISFGIKVGMAIGTAITAYGLAWAGYSPTAVTPQAIQGLTWLFYAIPIVFMLLTMLCISFYRLDARGPAARLGTVRNA